MQPILRMQRSSLFLIDGNPEARHENDYSGAMKRFLLKSACSPTHRAAWAATTIQGIAAEK